MIHRLSGRPQWIRGLLAIALLALCSAGQGAERTWLTLESVYFRAHTDASYESALAALTRLDQFRAQVLHFNKVRIPSGTTRITVLVLARPEEFAHQTGGPEGPKPVRVRGDSITIIMHAGQYTAAQSHALRHAYAHELLQHIPKPIPPWYLEGLAELMAATQVVDGTMLVGGKPGAADKNPGDSINPDEIIDGTISVHQMETAQAYLVPWALTHYLLLSKDPPSEKLQRYFELFREGKAPLDAFRKAFRSRPKKYWSRKIKRYLKEVPAYQMTLPDELLEARFRFEPANLNEVLAELKELQSARARW